jgi:hypothetical protein
MQKTILLILILIGFFTFSVKGQATTSEQNKGKTTGQIRLEQRQSSLNKTNPGGTRALNYGATMAELYGGNKYFDVDIFPDTLRRDYFIGQRNVRAFYFANIFDPASLPFSQSDEFNSTSGIYVTDKNPYSLDSIEIYVAYLRENNRYDKYENSSLSTDTITQDTVSMTSGAVDTFTINYVIRDSVVIDTINTLIADTLLVEIFNDNDKSNLIDTFIEGNVFNVNVSEAYPGNDTVFFKNIRYDRNTNTMIANDKVQYKVVLDSAHFELNALNKVPLGFSGTPTGPMEIDAAGLVVVGYSFIPGFDNYLVNVAKDAVDDTLDITYDTVIVRNQADNADSIINFITNYFTQSGFKINRIPKFDTIDNYNNIRVEAYEENGRYTYPIYNRGDFVGAFEAGENSYYNIPHQSHGTSFFGRLVPRYGRDDTLGTENLDILHVITCQTCFISSVEDGISFELQNAYPNPVDKGSVVTLPIQFNNSGDLTISIYSPIGELVTRKSGLLNRNGSFEIDIETEQLPIGMNIVSVESNGQKSTIRLIVMP